MIEKTSPDDNASEPVDPLAAPQALKPETPQDLAPGGHSVFLIGQDPPELINLFEWLSAAGYYTEATSDTARGLSYVRKHRPELVLAGLDLRSMTGVEVLDGIHEASPETRVVVVSDHVDWAVHELADRHRASAVISRAAGARLVLGVIKRLLDRKA